MLRDHSTAVIFRPARIVNSPGALSEPRWIAARARTFAVQIVAIGTGAESASRADKVLRSWTRDGDGQGLCTSTGVVEAGCKVAIGTRCKRAGMHWTVAGANAIIALRCCKLSGRFEEFWERRAQRRVA